VREPLEDLISTIPSVPTGQLPLDLKAGHFEIISGLPDQYVWPDVEVDGKSVATESALVLITAPGAMGKSAAAKAIAYKTRMPYVDLGAIRVGASTLTGEVSKAVGVENYSTFMADLKAGRAALILDSSDEAQLRVGRENYLAFIEDLAFLISEAEPAHQIIMLGRRDSTETTLIALDEQKLHPPVYRIAPLTHEQSSTLISHTLDAKTDEGGNARVTIHRQHPIPFGAFRDALFGDLAKALDPDLDVTSPSYWSHVEHFLGYPPVVVALAERLAGEENPKASLEELAATPRSGLPELRGVLLRRVVEEVMTREGTKVRKRVGDALTLREDDPIRIAMYGLDEQAVRLLTLTGTAGLNVEHPAVLDVADRAQYEQAIASFLLDHPFISNGAFANSVFSDYIRAWAVSSTLGEIYATARAKFFATLPKPGPFFTHFLHALSLGSDGSGRIPEDLVDDAIHSHARGLETGSAAYVQHGDTAVLMFRDETSTNPGHSLRFDVVEPSGVLVMTSPISRTLIVTEYGVLLRGVSDSVDLGPEVSIIAESIQIDAKSLTAVGDADGESTENIIVAKEAEHSADLIVKSIPAKSLAINWDDPWHQWSQYEVAFATTARIPRRVLAQIVVCVKRVLSSFKSSMVNDPSVSSEKMDRVIVGENEVFRRAFDAMLTLGVVAKEGNLYRVSLESLSSYGISWAALRGDDPMTVLRPLVDDILETPEMASLKDS
jgi:hypothetical protein